jgi:hypothetical protein
MPPLRPQDALVPGLTKASVQQGLQQRFSVDSDEELKGRTMAGWYLQQVRCQLTARPQPLKVSALARVQEQGTPRRH